MQDLPPLSEEQLQRGARFLKELREVPSLTRQELEEGWGSKNPLGGFAQSVGLEDWDPWGADLDEVHRMGGPMLGKLDLYRQMIGPLSHQDPDLAAHLDEVTQSDRDRAARAMGLHTKQRQRAAESVQRAVSPVADMLIAPARNSLVTDLALGGADKIFGTDGKIRETVLGGMSDEEFERGRSQAFLQVLRQEARSRNPRASEDEISEQVAEWSQTGKVPGWSNKVTHRILPTVAQFGMDLPAMGKIGGLVKEASGVTRASRAAMGTRMGENIGMFTATEALRQESHLPEDQRRGFVERTAMGAVGGTVAGAVGTAAQQLYRARLPAWLANSDKMNAHRSMENLLPRNKVGRAIDLPEYLASMGTSVGLDLTHGNRDPEQLLTNALAFAAFHGVAPHLGTPTKSFTFVRRGQSARPETPEAQRGREKLEEAEKVVPEYQAWKQRWADREMGLAHHRAIRENTQRVVGRAKDLIPPNSLVEGLARMSAKEAEIQRHGPVADRIAAERATYERWKWQEQNVERAKNLQKALQAHRIARHETAQRALNEPAEARAEVAKLRAERAARERRARDEQVEQDRAEQEAAALRAGLELSDGSRLRAPLEIREETPAREPTFQEVMNEWLPRMAERVSRNPRLDSRERRLRQQSELEPEAHAEAHQSELESRPRAPEPEMPTEIAGRELAYPGTRLPPAARRKLRNQLQSLIDEREANRNLDPKDPASQRFFEGEAARAKDLDRVLEELFGMNAEQIQRMSPDTELAKNDPLFSQIQAMGGQYLPGQGASQRAKARATRDVLMEDPEVMRRWEDWGQDHTEVVGRIARRVTPKLGDRTEVAAAIEDRIPFALAKWDPAGRWTLAEHMNRELTRHGRNVVEDHRAQGRPGQEPASEVQERMGGELAQGQGLTREQARAARERRIVEERERIAEIEDGAPEMTEARYERMVAAHGASKKGMPDGLWEAFDKVMENPGPTLDIDVGRAGLDWIARTGDLKGWKPTWRGVRDAMAVSGAFEGVSPEQVLLFEYQLARHTLQQGGMSRQKAQGELTRFMRETGEQIGTTTTAIARGEANGEGVWAGDYGFKLLKEHRTELGRIAREKDGFQGTDQELLRFVATNSESAVAKRLTSMLNRVRGDDAGRIRYRERKTMGRLHDWWNQLKELAAKGIGLEAGESLGAWVARNKAPLLIGAASLGAGLLGAPGGEIALAGLGVPVFGSRNSLGGGRAAASWTDRANAIRRKVVSGLKEVYNYSLKSDPDGVYRIPTGGFKDRKPSQISDRFHEWLGMREVDVGTPVVRLAIEREKRTEQRVRRAAKKFFDKKTGLFRNFLGEESQEARDYIGDFADGFAKQNGGKPMPDVAFQQEAQRRLQLVPGAQRGEVATAAREFRSYLDGIWKDVHQAEGRAVPARPPIDHYFHHLFQGSAKEAGVYDYVVAAIKNRIGLGDKTWSASDFGADTNVSKPGPLRERKTDRTDYTSDAVLSLQEYIPAVMRYIEDTRFRRMVVEEVEGTWTAFNQLQGEGSYRQLADALRQAKPSRDPNLLPKIAIDGKLERFTLAEDWSPVPTTGPDGKPQWKPIEIQLIGSGDRHSIPAFQMLKTASGRVGGIRQLAETHGDYRGDRIMHWAREQLGKRPALLENGGAIKEMLNFAAKWQTHGALGGLSPSSATNLIGGQFVILTEVGASAHIQATRRAQRVLHDAKYREFLRDQGVLTGSDNFIQYSSGARAKMVAKPGLGRRLAKGLGATNMFLFMTTENANRLTAFEAGRFIAERGIKRDGFNEHHLKLLAEWKINPKSKEAAERIAIHEGWAMMGRTLSDYTAGTTPRVFKSPIGRVAFHLGQYSLRMVGQQVHYAHRALLKGDKKAIARLSTFLGGAYLLSQIAQLLGRELADVMGVAVEDAGGLPLDIMTGKEGGLGTQFTDLRGNNEAVEDLEDYERDWAEVLGDVVIPIPMLDRMSAPLQSLQAFKKGFFNVIANDGDTHAAIGYEANKVREGTWDVMFPGWKTARRMAQGFQVEPVLGNPEVMGWRPEIPLFTGPNDHPYLMRPAPGQDGMWRVVGRDEQTRYFDDEGNLFRAMFMPGADSKMIRSIHQAATEKALYEEELVTRGMWRDEMVALLEEYNETGDPELARQFDSLAETRGIRYQDIARKLEQKQLPAWIRSLRGTNNYKVHAIARRWKNRRANGMTKHELQLAVEQIRNPRTLASEEAILHHQMSLVARSSRQ